MYLFRSFYIFVFCVMFVVNSMYLYAEDKTIVITRQINNIPNIQVVSSDGDENTMAIYKMLVQDLKTLGHFNVYYDDALKTDILQNSLTLQDYKNKNIDFIAQVSQKKKGDTIVANLSLYSYENGKIITTEYREEEGDRYPFIAHSMATYLNDYIKAPKADWMNRYVVFSNYVDSGSSNILIADYTFTYKKTIISNGLNVFPKWANIEQKEFYYTLVTDEATIYKYNMYNGKNEKIISSQGMAVVSDVSKQGDKLLLSLAPYGLSDIFLYDTKNKKVTQLTKYSGIDVNAHFIDNEKSFVFVSDRLGYPNIFMQDIASNNNVTQMVFSGRNNNTISTFGKYIVYSSRESNAENGLSSFNLYLISIDSDYIRRLSKIGINKIPVFSKDGDSIMFLRQYKNEQAIGVIRLSINKSFLFPLKNIKIQAFDW